MSVKLMLKEIVDLKELVKNFDLHFDDTIDTLTGQEEETIKLDQKLFEISKVNNEVTSFNINGEIIQVNPELFGRGSGRANFCKYSNNILSKMYSKYESRLDALRKEVIEIDSHNFEICLDLLREKKNQSAFNFGVDTIDYTLPKKTDEQILGADLKNFFNKDIENVLKDFNITYYDSYNRFRTFFLSNDINSHLISSVVSEVFQDRALKNYMTSGIENILSLSSKLAMFVAPEKTISFLFDTEVTISEILIKPFTQNPKVWYPGDGAGSLISVCKSIYGEFETIGRIPGNYGAEQDSDEAYSIKIKTPTKLREVKIQAGLYGLSIAYINFN